MSFKFNPMIFALAGALGATDWLNPVRSGAIENKIRVKRHPHSGKRSASIKPRYEWRGRWCECSGYIVNPRDYGSQVVSHNTREKLKLVHENHHTVIVEYPDGTQLKRHKIKHRVTVLN